MASHTAGRAESILAHQPQYRLQHHLMRSLMDLRSRVDVRYAGRILVVALAYYASAKGGLALAVGVKQVTAVWPPTGLALAALLIWGPGVWPGVALGAFVANLTTSEPSISAAGIMVGNTLEAVVGCYLITRVGTFRRSLDRTTDVVTLVALGAITSTLLSATVGVLSLMLGGVIPHFSGSTWKTWWLGDMTGDLLAAPAILVLTARLPAWWAARRRIDPMTVITTLLTSAAITGLGVLVFHTGDALAYALFPVLFFVSFRYGQVGAVLASIVMSALAVYFTSHGHGPFVGGSPDSRLLRAQTFIGVVAVTALLVAAVRNERERAEGELVLSEQLSAELERRVQERTRELLAANSELEAFSYSVSHDLRAPLRAIDGFSRVVISRYGDALDEDGRRMLNRVRDATQRMSVLIDELLDLSRITRKQMHRRPVNLSQLAREIGDELQATEPDRNVDLQITDGLMRFGDQELLRTMLQNLLENAWKFTAQQPAARVEFGPVNPLDNDELVIRDNGVGFDMAYVDKLFRPFERLHSQTAFGGTGVGLSIVQRIVHRHGGTVRAEATPNHGAAFFLTLPQRPEP